ncbi:hypothetical protein IGI04_001895 [Brassica rapa subsp. trilocularis]|uniref:Uncharacterized protein n=1 Tax=Brassica rapa subsp. trilocularis TaxID=1813537 RepID=A0ABQ7NU53_BRACM|nr:hypothetical protein IGI04_001895 [Brassica rapa subsp. trilocularis]
MIRVVEAYTALASPIKFPGCGSFFSSVAPVKSPEHGGSYRSSDAGFCPLVRSLRAPVWRGESMGDSPAVVETKMRVRIARRRPTSVSLSWVYGL